MDRLRPLGRRDIFGILLPGTILVFIGAYVLSGVLALMQLPVGDLLEHEFLLTAMLFVVAYLFGSLLRLFAADDVDKKSSEYLLKAWRKKHLAKIKQGCLSDFDEKIVELAKGNDVSDVPAGFDDWLWRVDDFPYPAWLNRFWRSRGFCGIFNFFQENYRTSMWPEGEVSRKSFFNYCKLVIIGSDGALADEVNMAEGLTRFYAGTVVAFRLSIWLLGVSLIAQVLLGVVLMFAPRLGIALAFSADWRFQGFHFVSTLVLIFVSQWMCRLIVKRFRILRQKEAETVYHAFFLYSTHHSDGMAKRDQIVLRKTLRGCLKNLF